MTEARLKEIESILLEHCRRWPSRMPTILLALELVDEVRSLQAQKQWLADACEKNWSKIMALTLHIFTQQLEAAIETTEGKEWSI